MRILVVSYKYKPNIGGSEVIAELLGCGFQEAGHEVQIVTGTKEASAVTAGELNVIRAPTVLELCRAVAWADVLVLNGIAAKFVWPLFLLRRPALVIHHIWLPKDRRGLLKRWFARRCRQIAVSQAVADSLDGTVSVIGNTYQDKIFRLQKEVVRDRDLIFVGRMVSSKGAMDLVSVIARLRDRGLKPNLTLVGDGPQRERIAQKAQELGVGDQVELTGVLQGVALAEVLNRHRVVVIPSRWHEPFGLVALEGIACGCVVVGSGSGGLADAIGRCGLTYPNGDIDALEDRLYRILTDNVLVEELRAHAGAHLAHHSKDRVIGEYLRVIEELHDNRV